MSAAAKIRTSAIIAGIAAAIVATSGSVLAQRGNNSAGSGVPGADAPQSLELGRFETLSQSFKLDKDQKTKAKTILDDAHKNAQGARDGLAKTRLAIAAAIQGGKPQAEIDSAVKDYAVQATAMTEIETKALADFLKLLTPEQRGSAPAIQAAFFMFRGIFLEKKWDIVPTGFYGY